MSSTRTIPHVLIVDNASHDGWVWGGALRRAGFRLSITEEKDVGSLSRQNDEFTLLIAIHDRRGCDGLELLRKVRAAGTRVPCLLICDRPAPDAAEIQRLLPPGALLERPITVAHFLATVRALLDTAHPMAPLVPARPPASLSGERTNGAGSR